MKKDYNQKPFTYMARNGVHFDAERCDFKTGIKVSSVYNDKITPNLIAEGVAEMIGYHCQNIWPELNGFAGYDCLQFNIK